MPGGAHGQGPPALWYGRLRPSAYMAGTRIRVRTPTSSPPQRQVPHPPADIEQRHIEQPGRGDHRHDRAQPRVVAAAIAFVLGGAIAAMPAGASPAKQKPTPSVVYSTSRTGTRSAASSTTPARRRDARLGGLASNKAT